MRAITFYLFLLLSITGLHWVSTAPKKWVIQSGCSLRVDGSTNINNFSCAIGNYNTPDTIQVTNITQMVLLNGNMRLSVENFDCHNSIMTADLRKTLKSKEFPKLVIRFVSMNRYPDAYLRNDITKGTVVIELAGVSRRYDVNYRVISAENRNITLEGSQQVTFSDFNLTPPRKMGGLIKTKNELSVVFTLHLRELD